MPEFNDAVAIVDTGSVDLSGPSKVRENVVAAVGSFASKVDSLAITESITRLLPLLISLSDFTRVDGGFTANPEVSLYDSIALVDGGDLDLNGSIRTSDLVLPYLSAPPWYSDLLRVIIDEVTATESLSSGRVTDWVYIRDDAGQSNPLYVREWVNRVLTTAAPRETLVIRDIPVSDEATVVLYAFNLTRAVSDSIAISNIPETDYFDPELVVSDAADSFGVTDSVTPYIGGIAKEDGTNTVVTDRPIPYLSYHMTEFTDAPESISVSEFVRARYSKLTVLVYDTIGHAESAPSSSAGGDLEDDKFLYRLRW